MDTSLLNNVISIEKTQTLVENRLRLTKGEREWLEEESMKQETLWNEQPMTTTRRSIFSGTSIDSNSKQQIGKRRKRAPNFVTDAAAYGADIMGSDGSSDLFLHPIDQSERQQPNKRRKTEKHGKM
eukprot:UN31720